MQSHTNAQEKRSHKIRKLATLAEAGGRVSGWLRREAFRPSILGVVVSPVYIIRRGLFRTIRDLAPALKGKILDFGCGSKPYKSLFENAKAYIGCDIEVSGHDHRHSVVDVFWDGKKLPFTDGEFDAVVSFETLEHVFNMEAVLAEICRVTRPAGHLLITVPFAWDEHEAPFDFARYTSFGIRHILEANGYRVVKAIKTQTYVLALFQLWIAYLMQHVAPKRKPMFAVFQLLVIFPITVSAFALNAILPKSDQYFCNNVLLAEKK